MFFGKLNTEESTEGDDKVTYNQNKETSDVLNDIVDAVSSPDKKYEFSRLTTTASKTPVDKVKRKRGRPIKQDKKRERRGRPSKKSLNIDPEASDSGKLSRKKSSQPNENFTDSQNKITSEISVKKVKKKRGRPSKNSLNTDSKALDLKNSRTEESTEAEDKVIDNHG